MTSIFLRPLAPELLAHYATEAAGQGQAALAACRAIFVFECDPPLDRDLFPGPALRGLLGRALEQLGSPTSRDFLSARFRQAGGDDPGLWRLAFLSPPGGGNGTFEVQFTTYGTHAFADLKAAADAFALFGLIMDVSGHRHSLVLIQTEPAEAALLEVRGEKESHGEGLTERTNESGAADAREVLSASVHCLTPLLINTGGRRLSAEALSRDATPLFDSLRLRFADLAGLRRDDPRLVPDFAAVPRPDRAEVGDVELHLPLQARHQRLVGIVGSLGWNQLPCGPASLLRAASWLGGGRQTAYGAGTLVFEECNHN